MKLIYTFIITLTLPLFIHKSATAQYYAIVGDGVVTPGTIGTYTYSIDPIDAVDSWFINPVWSIAGTTGTITNTSISANGLVATCKVRCTGAGTATLTFKGFNNSVTSTKSITAPPAPPVFSFENYICGSSGTAAITASSSTTGAVVQWYTAAQGGTPIYTGMNYSTPALTASTTYYIASYGGGVASSPRTPVVVMINNSPGVPVSPVAGSSCVANSTIVLSASLPANATALWWYSAASGNNYLSAGTSYTTPPLTQTTTYYVAAMNDKGCPSERIPVTAIIGSVVATPGAKDTWILGSGSVMLTADVGNPNLDILWYNAATDLAPIATGSTFQTPFLTQNKTYYVRARDPLTNCISNPAEMLVIVQTLITSPSSVRAEIIRVPGKKNDASLNGLTVLEKTATVNYLDGLQRVHQSVAVQASPLGQDVVQPVEYDSYGRASRQLLPYASTKATGEFHPGYNLEQFQFYNTAGDKVADDSAPYAIAKYEASPLGRIVEQGAPGQAWQPGGGHTATAAYSFNTGATASEAEEVRQFNVDGSSSSFFTANMLNRIQTTGEDGGGEIAFTDSRGRTLVRKKRLDQIIAGQTVSYLQTYYIYDDYDRLKYIISPKGTATLRANGWSLTADIKDNYVYQFSYDSRGRLIGKKVPGQAWLYYIYDPLDRVVLTQDGLLRASNKWLFMKYDQMGRPVLQGLYLNTIQTDRTAVQLIANSLYSSSNETYPEIAWYETRGTALHGYTNTSFPKTNANNTALEILNVNFYDSYDFDDADTADDYAYVNQGMAGEATQGRSFGLPTGSKRLVLGTTTWLYNYMFYDKYGRAIQTRSNNHLSAAIDNLTTNVYDFEGKLLLSKTTHKGGTGKETTVTQRQEYDSAGRIKNIYRPIATPQPIQWTNLVKATAAGNTITKTGTTTGWDAGGFSVNHLDAGQDGWIEFKVNSTTTGRIIGFSDQDVSTNFTTIDYGLYPSSVSATLQVYENGLARGPFGTYAAGDFFSVERKNGIVYYKKNNQVFYTSTIPSTGVVYVDCSLYNANASGVDVKLFTTKETLVAQYEYNELGQMVDKKLHNTTGTDFLQSVDYRYNIRGWLSSINNATLDGTTAINDEANDYFGMEFLYNNVQSDLSNTATFNGNISAAKWKGPGATTAGTTGQKSYKYSYDKASQLRAAAFQVNTGTAWTDEAGALNESMNYDHNGNITDLQRNQRKYQNMDLPYTAQTIDNLTYTYNSTIGDQLQKVEDATTITAGFKNGASAATEYTYDVNGNLLSDQNKGISGTTYNVLGKPSQITFSDGRKVQYVYDAAGNKLTMKTYAAGATNPNVTTDYAGGFVYENTNLSFYAAPEGRIVMNKSYPEYQYGITDNQGNTRVLFTSATPQPETTTVNFEALANTEVQNYPTGAYRNSMDLYDHTDAGTTYTYSQLLNGGNSGQVGISKSFKVFPGDKVKIEAYAKYSNPQNTSANLTTFTTSLLVAFGAPTPAVGETGTISSGLASYGGIIGSGDGPGNSEFPKAFVNIVLYDKDYNLIDFTFDQINGGEQVGVSPSADHDYMSAEYTAKEAGYAYVFISNENPTLTEVYFDDVTITRTPTNIVQYNEYYPFGLQAGTSWTRDNSKNSYLYNAGSELNATSGWYDLFFRNYDPALGRFVQVDPMAADVHELSSYNYANNNPALYNDPLGDKICGECDAERRAWAYANYKLQSDYNNWYQDLQNWLGSVSSFGGSVFDHETLDALKSAGFDAYIDPGTGQVNVKTFTGVSDTWAGDDGNTYYYKYYEMRPLGGDQQGPHNDSYRDNMSREELAIFDRMTPWDKTAYLTNAKAAVDRAELLYGKKASISGKGDAFRHAYFSGLNASYFGLEMAKRLGDAHELKPGQHPRDIEMDLYNNAAGRFIYLRIATSEGIDGFYIRRLREEIVKWINTGLLKEIDNLKVVPTDPNRDKY